MSHGQDANILYFLFAIKETNITENKRMDFYGFDTMLVLDIQNKINFVQVVPFL